MKNDNRLVVVINQSCWIRLADLIDQVIFVDKNVVKRLMEGSLELSKGIHDKEEGTKAHNESKNY